MTTRTVFLARLIGLYGVIVSLTMLASPDALLVPITAMVHDPAALLVAVLVGLVAGLAMVLAHNVWSGGALPVVVTVIGWWLLLKSLFALVLPATSMLALFETWTATGLYRWSSTITLLLGVYLLYASIAPDRSRR